LPQLKVAGRLLRNDPTPTEALLWQRLRKKQIDGYLFYRQRPIGCYVVDFYCPAAKLVIEIDGGYHLEAQQQANDQVRTEYLEALELRVIRFSNDEVNHNIETCLQRIKQALSSA
jgi:very-short-patch-repair endonuclease